MPARREKISFAWEPLDRLIDDGIEDILALNWEEIDGDKDIIPLAPDWDRYRLLERAKSYRALSGRASGRIVAYAGYFVWCPYHHKFTPHAFNDLVFAEASYRALAGVGLIRRAEYDLFAGGAVKITYSVKRHVLLDRDGESRLGKLLARLGYVHDEDHYAKVQRG